MSVQAGRWSVQGGLLAGIIDHAMQIGFRDWPPYPERKEEKDGIHIPEE